MLKRTRTLLWPNVFHVVGTTNGATLVKVTKTVVEPNNVKH